jgi:ABC-2 type transport system ATP-binding protein
VRALIERFHEQGITFFLTTHYLEEADRLCDRVALLVKGKVLRMFNHNPEKILKIVHDQKA